MLEILNNINQYLYHKIEETDPILLELEAYAKFLNNAGVIGAAKIAFERVNHGK